MASTLKVDTLEGQSGAGVAATITSGTITGITDLAIADGGTGASTAAGARTALDVPSNSEVLLDTFIDAKGDLITGTAADTPAILSVGTDGYVIKSQSGATKGLQYLPPQAGWSMENGYVDWSVSGNVLTIAIKTWAGADPSATDPVYVTFRNATVATPSLTRLKITAATSIAIDDTATLGTTNSVAFKLWAVLFNDGGTARMGVINCLSGTSLYPLAGWGIASSTQESATADSAHVFYTDGAAVTSMAYTILGYATWESGLATAGTWSAEPTREQLWGVGILLPGEPIQTQRTAYSAVATGTTTIPFDDTIPQNTEGDEYMTRAITPTSASNLLIIEARGSYASTMAVNNTMAQAIFQDTTAGALSIMTCLAGGSVPMELITKHRMLAATTSSTTFKARAGAQGAGTTTFNGNAGARAYGGVYGSFMEVQEIMT